VKHHLRAMADRGGMLTTYEHDFGFMVRPKPDMAPDTGRSRRSTASSSPARSIRAPGAGRDAAAAGGGFSRTLTHQGLVDSPLRLSVNGWGDTAWSPQTHPSMVHGMSKKRVNLVQTTNILNLRAPDVPFSTR